MKLMKHKTASPRVLRTMRCGVSKRGCARRARTVRSKRGRLFAAILAWLATLAGARMVSAQAGASSEYQVKAAFLFHFAQFIEWPQESSNAAGKPLTYCTVGEDPFQGALDESLNGKTIGTRPLQVRHLKQPRDISNCQILFMGAAQKKILLEVLTTLKESPVLTVGESEHFVRDGGMIGFFLEENKIRFDINLKAAQRANLKISSRLLLLAKTVIGDGKSG